MKKYIFIHLTDSHRLQIFLNQQSERGYHAIRVGLFSITFTYDPQARYYYQVSLPQKFERLYKQEDNYIEKKNFLEAFGLEAVKSHLNLEVYKSSSNIPLNTDPTVDDVVIRKITRNILLNSLLLIVLFTSNLYSSITMGLFETLRSGSIQALIVFSAFSFIFILVDIFKMIRYKKGIIKSNLGYRWKIGRIDPVISLILLTLSLIIILAFPSKAALPYLYITLLLYIYLLINTLSPNQTKNKLMSKIIGFFALLIFGYMILPSFRYEIDFNKQKNESILLKETIYFENIPGTVVVNIKHKFMNQFILNAFLKEYHINETPKKSVITPYKTWFGETNYVYWSDNIAIIGMNESDVSKYIPN